MGCVFEKLLCCDLNKGEAPPDDENINNIGNNKRTAHKVQFKTLTDDMYSKTESNSESLKKYESLNIGEVNDISQIKIRASSLIKKRSGLPSQFYEKISILGSGSYGTVLKVYHKLSNEYRSMKVIQKQFLTANITQQEIDQEIEILKNLDHPNIIKINEIFVDDLNVYIIAELCTEGSLYDKIDQLNFLNENFVKILMFQILSAVNYLHGRGVIHGDLKPDNIMIEKVAFSHKFSFRTSVLKDMNEPENGPGNNFSAFEIKLIDFGCSKIFTKKREKFHDIIGTLNYISPEVLNNDYNEKCDLWSCGVIMYLLLTGILPFLGEDEEEIKENISKGKINFNIDEFRNVSPDAISLLKGLLTYNPEKRLSAAEALAHPFISGTSRKSLPEDLINSKNILGNLKKFSGKSKFYQAVLSLITHNFAKKENIEKLRATFKQIDKNNDGLLSKEELLESYNECGLQIGREEIDTILTNVDSDSNGYIEYEEFIRAVIDKKTIFTDENLKFAFDLIDRDKNGAISFSEIKNLIGIKNLSENVSKDLQNEINMKYDKDMNFEEFKEFIILFCEQE